MTDVKKRMYHLDDRPLLSLLLHVSVLKHFPGWDTSFLNEVMSLRIATSIFSFFFFQLADDFNMHGWVEWVDATFFP